MSLKLHGTSTLLTTDAETVFVDIDDRGSARAGSVLPDTMQVQLEVDGKTVNLDLHKNKKDFLHVPIRFINPDTKVDIPKPKVSIA